MEKEIHTIEEDGYEDRIEQLREIMNVQPLRQIDRGLVDALEEIPERMVEEERGRERKRRLLLEITRGEEIIQIEYTANLPQELILSREDKEKAKKVLEGVGEERYTDREENWTVYTNDSEEKMWVDGWSYLELRWPEHYAGYIDSLTIHRNFNENRGELWLTFLRGRRTNQDELDREAASLYTNIKEGLERAL